MTDRELLEQINGRLDKLESLVTAFIQNTESNFSRVFERLDRFDRQFENLDARIDLVMQELIGVKIQTKSRMDRMEARIETLEQRTR